MAKTRQVLKFCDQGKEYKVIKEIGVWDRPYKIYNLYRDLDQYGYPRNHKKLVARCDSLGECFKWFYLNL